MADKTIKGFPDTWGEHNVPLVDHKGPSSYASGGEVITAPFLGPRIYAFIVGGLTYSGTYRVDAIYGSTGLRSSVNLKWTVASTGQEVAGGVNLSGETVRLLVIGG